MTTTYHVAPITVTALGTLPSYPLTTFFTPPPDCTDATAYLSATRSDAQIAYNLLQGALRPTCAPLRYKTLQYDQSQWYSPGVCPTQYEYVATSRGVGNDGGITTFAICCPPGLHSGGDGYSCRQTMTNGAELSFSTMGSSVTAYGNPVSVAWQEKDLSLFEPASAPLLALSSAGVHFPGATSEGGTLSAPTSAPGATAGRSDAGATSSSSPTGSASTSHGLSTGAAAGVGVGATIGGLALLAGLWLLIRRRRSSRRNGHTTDDAKEGIVSPSPPLLSTTQSGQYVESAAKRQIVEAPDEALLHEAGASNERVELDAAGQEVAEAPGQHRYVISPK